MGFGLSMSHARFSLARARAKAKETIDYSIADNRNDLITIRKIYHMQTGEQRGNMPNLQMNGDGQLVFDVRKGVMASIAMKYTIVATGGGKPETVTLTVDCLTMSPGESDQLAKQVEESSRLARKRLEEEDRKAEEKAGKEKAAAAAKEFQHLAGPRAASSRSRGNWSPTATEG